MQETRYKTSEDVLKAAKKIEGHSLRELIPEKELESLEASVLAYGNRRRGLLGDLVEQYVFGLANNGRAEADFHIAGVELKTTPLRKHPKSLYVSKERLVFSMINYDEIVKETWETSSFLEKNKRLLILFYLWLKEQSILDHEFRFVHFLDLLTDLSAEDSLQIKKDWEFIVEKIKRGEAHMLSEGDTFYLGACTKAKNSGVVRDQPRSRVPAKPRAFSFKQTYLNYLIQTRLLNKKVGEVTIRKRKEKAKTIDEIVEDRFSPYIGKTDTEICRLLGISLNKRSKNYRRSIANHILTGSGSNKIEELEKANITLKALALEPTGGLKESISFPAFDFKDLTRQIWYDEGAELLSDLYAQLDTKKFLFVIFQKQKGSEDIVLKKTMFWNFPAVDMDKAEEVWKETVKLINEGKVIKDIVVQKNGKKKTLTHFPGASFNGVVHVRPHGLNANDESELVVPDQKTGKKTHTKQAFWINAKYIQQAIENQKDQY